MKQSWDMPSSVLARYGQRIAKLFGDHAVILINKTAYRNDDIMQNHQQLAIDMHEFVTNNEKVEKDDQTVI